MGEDQGRTRGFAALEGAEFDIGCASSKPTRVEGEWVGRLAVVEVRLMVVVAKEDYGDPMLHVSDLALKE